jgi:hypothetical protein
MSLVWLVLLLVLLILDWLFANELLLDVVLEIYVWLKGYAIVIEGGVAEEQVK